MSNHIYYPFAKFGYTSIIWSINTETLFHLIIGSCISIFFAFLIRYFLLHSSDIKKKLVYIFFTIYQLINQTCHSTNNYIFTFIFSFGLIMICYNLLSLIPYLEEPTKDINVTFALGIFSFLGCHSIAYSLQKREYLWRHWLKTPLDSHLQEWIHNKYFYWIEIVIKKILNVLIAIIALPFELFGKLSSVLSLSFRLFGNIFGGSMVSSLGQSFFSHSIIYHVLGIITGLSTIILGFFGCFEGLIQSFIFLVITINNLAMLLNEEH
jgi:F-type H+-transporting ATPase subunit a